MGRVEWMDERPVYHLPELPMKSMDDLNPARDPFPEWPFGIDPEGPRRTLMLREDVDIPIHVQTCPYCDSQLEAKVATVFLDGEWEIVCRCPEGDPDAQVDHTRLPYDNWLPAEKQVEDYLKRVYQVITDSDHVVTGRKCKSS